MFVFYFGVASAITPPVAVAAFAAAAISQASPLKTAGGRGGQALGPIVAPGRYRATLGSLSGGTVTPLGEPQAFQVVPLPR
jgi:hypothetical protein